MAHFDAVIVGGGPAGCSAALTLKLQGLSVIVIDSPPVHKRPTETSSPQLRQALTTIDALGALEACEPCYEVSSIWGELGTKHLSGITNPYGNAHFIHRKHFDSILKQITEDKGAVWKNTKAKTILMEKKKVSVVTSDNEIVEASWLILAAGSIRQTAQLTTQKVIQLDSLTALWTTFPKQTEEKILRVETTDHGWWYTCPSTHNETLVCFITNSDLSKSYKSFDAWYDSFSKTNLSKSILCAPKPSHLNIDHTGLATLERKFGSQWVAVGDAAQTLDPIGSSGTLMAIESGRKAALAVSIALQGNTSSLEEYEYWTERTFTRFSTIRKQHYSLGASNPKSDFWSKHILGQLRP